ncbi:peptidoglycan-binding domain-containing protein [Pseudomonas wadenswilerensis]
MSGITLDVAQGDSAESLAFAHGHFLDTVWQHANNTALRELRKNPHILFPGDRLFIPAIEPRQETASTDRRHRFKRRGVPSSISFQLRDGYGAIIADVAYRLELGGEVLTGRSAADGTVTTPLMPDVATGKLSFEWRGEPWEIQLGLRTLDPIDRLEGVQKRLQNLGFYSGEINGLFDQATLHAVQRFQLSAGIATSGSIDDATKGKLLEVHGC